MMRDKLRLASEEKEISGYKIRQTIYQSPQTLVYRGIRKSDGTPVVIKTLNQEYPSLQALARLQHEYRMLENSKSSGVIHSYGLERYGNNLALILEDQDADTQGDDKLVVVPGNWLRNRFENAFGDCCGIVPGV